MRTAPGRLALVALLALLAACAPRRSARNGARPSRDVITREQIRAQSFTNAYDLVAALHSNWLTTRGPDSFQNPSQMWVYVDNVRVGGVESLRTVETSAISFIRYYDGIAATGRWGLDHGRGVIFVSTRPE